MNLKRVLKPSSPRKRQNMKSLDSSSLSSFTASFSRASMSSTFDREASFLKTCSPRPDADELECMENLSTFCLESHRQISNDLIVRYAVFYNFNFEKAKNAILKRYSGTYSYLYLKLETELLQFVLKSKVFFPLPGLKSRKTASEVFYFRPSRYEPSSTNNGLLLDNLCYVLNDMSRTIDQCRNGVVMIVNMSGYTMKNYHNETQMKMAKIIEGHVIPTRVVEILIVNPPKLFARLWKVVKPAFSTTFKKRIHIIKNDELDKYLMDDSKRYFPDEFLGDYLRTNEMVVDYVDLKLYEEQQRAM